MILQNNSIYDIANSYSQQGICCIPIKRVPNNIEESKKPTVSWKHYQRNLPTEIELHEWFDEKTLNIAIVTGNVSGGLIVVDFDNDKAYGKWAINNPELSQTPTAKTDKGHHVFFRVNGNCPGNIKFDFEGHTHDIKGEGGYVVAPPSVHGSGHQYYWLENMAPWEMTIATIERLNQLELPLHKGQFFERREDEMSSAIDTNLLQSLKDLNSVVRGKFSPEKSSQIIKGVTEQIIVSEESVRHVTANNLPYYATINCTPTVENKSAGKLVTDLEDWLGSVCNQTPLTMVHLCAEFLVSALIYRRVRLSMSFGDIFPNLFGLIVGPPGLVRKTTVAANTRRVLRKLQSPIIESIGTPESFERELSLVPHVNTMTSSESRERWLNERQFFRTRSALLEEIGGLFSGWQKKDYLSGAKEMILQAYDSDEIRTSPTKGGGVYVIEKAYMSLLGLTTTHTIANSMRRDNSEWLDGTFSRFDFAFELNLPETSRPTAEEYNDIPVELVTRLKKLYMEMLPVPSVQITEARKSQGGKELEPEKYEVTELNPITATFADGVLRRWYEYEKEYYIISVREYNRDPLAKSIGNYSRVPTKALKRALLYAICDWADAGIRNAPICIEMKHLERGMYQSETYRQNLQLLTDALAGRAAKMDAEQRYSAVELYEAKIFDYIASSTSGYVSERDLKRQFQGQSFDEAFKKLLSSNRIKTEKIKLEGDKRVRSYVRVIDA